MDTAVINFKVDKKTKREAHKIADELGISLSSLIKAYLRELIRTKRVVLTLEEEPNKYMIDALKESKKNIEAGRVVSFNNIEDAVEYFKKLSKGSRRSWKKA